jgi:Xaa-Pro aminopeptidase
MFHWETMAYGRELHSPVFSSCCLSRSGHSPQLPPIVQSSRKDVTALPPSCTTAFCWFVQPRKCIATKMGCTKHRSFITLLENTLGAFLAIDGVSGESWLFLSSTSMGPGSHLSEIAPGPESQKLLGIDHVVDLSALQQFLAQRAVEPKNLYYISPFRSLKEIPANIVGTENANAPLWVVVIAQKWPAFHLKDATQSMHAVMAIQSADEVDALRSAGKSTVSAMMASLKVVHPGESPRTVELAVVDNCWKAGAHGVSYWPFIMAGKNGVVPTVYASSLRYDHLDTVMQAGDLIHFDIGCEWNHYNGDLGRTVPVSGHFPDDQRETWNIFVAASRAAVSVFRDGVTEDQVFDAWSAELLRHHTSAKSSLAHRAIDSWSKRENVPYWVVHYTHLFPARKRAPARRDGHRLRAGRCNGRARVLPGRHIQDHQGWSGAADSWSSLYRRGDRSGHALITSVSGTCCDWKWCPAALTSRTTMALCTQGCLR